MSEPRRDKYRPPVNRIDRIRADRDLVCAKRLAGRSVADARRARVQSCGLGEPAAPPEGGGGRGGFGTDRPLANAYGVAGSLLAPKLPMRAPLPGFGLPPAAFMRRFQ